MTFYRNNEIFYLFYIQKKMFTINYTLLMNFLIS